MDCFHRENVPPFGSRSFNVSSRLLQFFRPDIPPDGDYVDMSVAPNTDIIGPVGLVLTCSLVSLTTESGILAGLYRPSAQLSHPYECR